MTKFHIYPYEWRQLWINGGQMPQSGTQRLEYCKCGQIMDKWSKNLRMWTNCGQKSYVDKLWINFLRRGNVDKSWTNFRRMGICPQFAHHYNCGVSIWDRIGIFLLRQDCAKTQSYHRLWHENPSISETSAIQHSSFHRSILTPTSLWRRWHP